MGIPAKIVKASKSVIAPQLSTLINITVDTGVFPDRLKKAQVTPLFKKNDPLVISNYRPVSILPIFSKLFEKVIETQLNDFFGFHFQSLLVCISTRSWMSDYVTQITGRLERSPR